MDKVTQSAADSVPPRDSRPLPAGTEPAGRKSRTLVIQPKGGWQAVHLHEVWQYRDLLYFLIRRDLRVRFRHPAAMAIWIILPMLVTAGVFSALRAHWAAPSGDELPYACLLLTGLVPWTYFSNALTRTMASLDANANLISKVYFPRLVLPAAATLAGLADFAIGLGLLALVTAWYGIVPAVSALLIPFLALLAGLLVFGAGLWLAALGMLYRDLRQAVPLVIQIGMFATPIVYSLDSIPAKWRILLRLNPMTGVVEGFRSALFGFSWDLEALAISVAVAAALLVGGAFYFRRVEHTFAESM